jgi:3-deoxy-D-manno-octulosonate 8-phosphate phosphatase (KDO 8-P phosphatase)
MDNILKAKKIKMVMFDVDGVLTDGRLYLTDDNIEIKAFNSQDGLGFKFLRQTGVDIAIITARQSKLVAKRMKSLHIEHVYQGKQDKLSCYKDLLKKTKLKNSEVCYVGDDVLDLPILRQAGLAVAPANAHEFIKSHVDFVTVKSGGMGAAREVCDFIMKAQGTFDAVYKAYL